MKLRDLFSDDATIDPQAEAAACHRPCGGQPRGQAGRSVLRARRQQDRRRALHRCRRLPPARSRSRAIIRRKAAVRVPFVVTPNPRRALALAAAKFLSAAARNHRGRHRHQRQDLGRRLHAADLAAARSCIGQHRHHRAGVAEAHHLRIADDAGSDRAASPARRNRARGRHPSRARGLLARARPVSAGRRAHRAPAASPICRATTWITIPTSRIISPPSCGCSAIWSPPDGAAVISADHDCSQAVIDAARERKLADRSRSAARAMAQARAFAWSRPTSTALRRSLTLEHRGRRHAVRLPLVGEFQIENALVAAGLAIGTGSEPQAVFSPRSNISKAPKAGWSGSASATARRSSSITRTSPMRWRRRCRRCGPMPSASSSWCSAPAATAMPASGR